MSAPSLQWSTTARELALAVIREAEQRDWRVYQSAIPDQKSGFPTLLLVRGKQMLAVTCLSQRAHPTEAQVSWLADLDAVPGVEAHLWSPTDKADGLVTAALVRRGDG